VSSPITWLESRGNQIATCVFDPDQLLSSTAKNTVTTVKVPKPTVVFCGGFKSNMQGTKAIALQQLCTANHWPYVRFDYSGHGQSAGNFVDGNIDSWMHDTLTVVDAINNPLGIVLVGSSMGAWLATLVALKRASRVRGLITIAAAPDFTERMLNNRLNQKQLQTINSGQPLHLPSDYDDGSPYPITLQLIQKSRQHCLLEQSHRLDIPVRMLHGTSDIDVPYATSIALMNALICDDARLTLIKNADHRLSSAADIKLLETTLIEMLELLQE